jgi:hypothetical protein
MLNGLSGEQVEMGSIVFSNLDRAIDDPIINPMRSNVKSTHIPWFSWFVLWLRLRHNVGSSWVPPQEDVLNDRQYTTRRLSALSLFSVLTLPSRLIRRALIF